MDAPPPAHDDERAIIARIRAGDEGALRMLYTKYHVALWKFAHGYTRDRDSAEDLVHDVFLSLWERGAAWDVRDNARVWLYGAVRNRALQWLRHARVVARAEDAVLRGAITPPAMGTPQLAADAALEAEATRHAVARAVAAMPELRRAAATLRWNHELSYDEIATLLQISAGAVRVHVARARETIAAAIPRD